MKVITLDLESAWQERGTISRRSGASQCRNTATSQEIVRHSVLIVLLVSYLSGRSTITIQLYTVMHLQVCALVTKTGAATRCPPTRAFVQSSPDSVAGFPCLTFLCTTRPVCLRTTPQVVDKPARGPKPRRAVNATS
jgi:hypothetical protein